MPRFTQDGDYADPNGYDYANQTAGYSQYTGAPQTGTGPGTDPNANRTNQIQGAYQQYLGRAATQNDINSWLGNNDFMNGIKNSPEAAAYAAKQNKGTDTSPNGSGFDYSSYDPRLASIFQKYGITPTGAGTGNTDISYWQNKISQPGADANYYLGRLDADLAGNGMDSAGGGFAPEAGSTILSLMGGLSSIPNPQMQSLLDQLMSRANQSLSINPTNDPIIQPQVTAYSAQQERSRRNYLNDLAESNSPYATGAAQTAATQTAETAGQQTGALQSQLVQNELTARRTEIQNALSEAGSLLTADEQLQLQKELGIINAALQQQSITNANDQFNSQLGLNATNQANYWDAINTGKL